MKKSLFGIIFMALLMSANAQSSIVATGGEATGNGGSVSFSVGQIVVQSNGDGTTTISEGVQQPYEISVVGVDDYPAITLNATVYPNPTLGQLQLSVSNEELLEKGEARIFDGSGKLLAVKRIVGQTTDFDLSPYAQGTYYLRVTDGKTTLKTFKVVKMTR